MLLLGTGIDNAMKNSDSDKMQDDPNQSSSTTTNTTSSPGDGSKDGTHKGGRTRAYGWWKRSHASAPYVATDHYKNIRRTKEQSNE